MPSDPGAVARQCQLLLTNDPGSPKIVYGQPRSSLASLAIAPRRNPTVPTTSPFDRAAAQPPAAQLDFEIALMVQLL